MFRHAATTSLILAALALGPALPASAQLGELELTGEVTVGGRTLSGDDDEALFARERDLEQGAIAGFDLSLEHAARGYWIRGRGENAGYDDQRFQLEGGRYGAFTIDLFYGELPRLYSDKARTLYVRQGDSSFALPAGVQASIQGGTPLATELQNARRTPLELRWIEGRGGVEAHVSESIVVDASYRVQDKHGTIARALNFGSPGGSFATVAASVDEQIHELRLGGELVHERSTLRLDYTGSFFENDLDSLTVANPLIDVETASAARAGRAALSPDNAAHEISATGTTVLPLAFPATASATLAYGIQLQDEDFLPHTRNPFIVSPGLALPRKSLDGRVETWLANLVLTASPVPKADVTLRYRLYDRNNKTDVITFDERVENDGSLVTEDRSTVFPDYQRQEAELDARYRVTDDLTAGLGYGWEFWKRSQDRPVERLHEHGPNAQLTWRPGQRVRVQGTYRFRSRTGDDYDPYAFFDRSDPLPQTPFTLSTLEFSRLRKFDVADRMTHDARVIGHVVPCDALTLTLNGGVRYEDYDESDYGLTEVLRWNLGTDASWVVHPRVVVSVHYSYESVRIEQASRWRPRSVFGPPVLIDDPRNDWSSRLRERFHSAGVDLDLVLVKDRLDARIGYLIQQGTQKQRTGSPPGSVGIAPFFNGDTPFDWPTVEHRLQAVTTELDLHLGEHLTLTGGYRLEKHEIDDFRTNDLGPTPPPGNSTNDVFLGDSLDDALVHVVIAKATVRF